MEAKKIAFIKQGTFSNINPHISHILERHFPEYQVEVIDIWEDVIRKGDLLNLFYCLKEYSGDIVTRRRTLRSCMIRTSYFFKVVRKRLHKLLNPDEYLFSLQTQSLFDGSVRGIPHFVYTDHTNTENIHYQNGHHYLFPQKYQRMENMIFQHAELVFTMSHNVEKSLQEYYRCPPDKIKNIYAGSNIPLDYDSPSQRDARSFKKRILFVGMEWNRKGGPLLEEAFRLVLDKHPDARLTIAGTAPEMDLPNCEILGKVPLAELPRYFKDSDVFCMPTLREPFGIVFVEAMHYGLPIVATRQGAIPDFVEENKNGYLLKKNTPQELAGLLNRLLGSSEHCRAFGRKGREKARAYYTWDLVGKRMSHYIREHLRMPAALKILPHRYDVKSG